MGDAQPDAGKLVDFSALSAADQDLIKRSAAVRQNAYVKYSGFRVGSAILCADGSIVDGCNVETGAPGSICAERTAIVKAVSEGKTKFLKVAVVADKLRDVEYTAPCGVCRQFIVEFGTETEILLSPPAMDKVIVTSIKEILPLSFQLIK